MNQQPVTGNGQNATRNSSPFSWTPPRLVLLVFLAAATLLMAWHPLANLMRAADRGEYYSHIILIPFVTAYFLYQYRKPIFESTGVAPFPGAIVLGCGLVLYIVGRLLDTRLGPNDFASLTTLSSVVFFVGGFILLYGFSAFRAAQFPLLFLLFAVPIPQFLLEGFIRILLIGSNEVTEWLFELTDTYYIRNGFIYRLPGITIEVAKECSGIRSSIALIITGVLAGHLFLRSGCSKLILLLTIVPFTIFKNGIRIVTLSLLAIYVDRKFITDSFLHHSGGFVFYLPALAMLGGVLWWLRRWEQRANVKAEVKVAESKTVKN
jgi:exosortase